MSSPAEPQSSTADRPAGEAAIDESVQPPEGAQESQWAAERAKLEDRWRRALADLDNVRKRYARELERERDSERSKVAGTWLPVVDDLERAVAHAGDQSEAIVAGVRAILDQAVHVLEQLGYSRDTEAGIPFDPQRHEVVGVVERSDSAPGTVVEVVRPGYGQGARQLRPASVVVSRGRE